MIIFLNHQTRYEKLPSTFVKRKQETISLEMIFAGYIANEQIVVIMMKIG